MRRGNLAEILRYFLGLGVVGFGGPNAHIAMMHDDLVVRRRWVGEQEFIDILGTTNLIPGPNFTEIAIHLGHERGGRLGGLIAGLAFAAPAFVLMVELSWASVAYGPTHPDRPAGRRAPGGARRHRLGDVPGPKPSPAAG